MLATSLPQHNFEATRTAVAAVVNRYQASPDTLKRFSPESVEEILSVGWQSMNAGLTGRRTETLPGSSAMHFALVDVVLTMGLNQQLLRIERDQTCRFASNGPLGVLPGNYGEAVLELIGDRPTPQNLPLLRELSADRFAIFALGEVAAFCNRYRLWDDFSQLRESSALSHASL